jgi:hypothetical protein
MKSTLAVSLGMFFLCSCGPAVKPITLVANMSVPQYLGLVKKTVAKNSAETSAPVTMFYPILEIFDPAGKMVFYGDDVSKNLAILAHASSDLSRLKHGPGQVNLPDIMGQVPEFQPYIGQIAGNNKYTFLSVMLRGCDSCRKQEDVLQEMKNKAAATTANQLFLVLDD